MTATPALIADLRQQVRLMEEDLWGRVAADPELDDRWKREHRRAIEKERTAASWITWRDDRVTQAAVAWVLTTVFIRFCEDNSLVGPVWITGPEHRRQEALDAQVSFFRTHPEDTDREWLQTAIDHLAALPATRALVDYGSALHYVTPSGNAVTKLLDFWRMRTEDDALAHDLKDTSLATRFLGDLYQELSQYAKRTYALLQTPVFVAEFILDRTLEPALKERPLENFKLIDPACGSGHFLLSAFGRLLDKWHQHAPVLEVGARVQAALDAIHGVDLNPFAIAITRFRLTVAALQASRISSLEAAPTFTFHLAAGDSLIHGPAPDALPGMRDHRAYMSLTYKTEDGSLLLTMLEEGRYDVVVGSPPHITVKDKVLNQVYRSKYANVCTGKYSLTVPFMAKFFSLAKSGEQAGWVGQITSNAFMKREFGAKLIEDFLPQLDLRLVADTSGAYIPGHGTPTVIIVGRNHQPVGSTVRAILGVRAEPKRPEDPAKGIVWTSLVAHVDDPGWGDDWITVTDLDRAIFGSHPWSLSGGTAVGLNRGEAFSGHPSRRAESFGTQSSTLEDGRVAPYLGRVLDDYGEPTGTCFQVASGVLVTAWHVLEALGAGKEGATITVDPLQGGLTRQARVERADPLHDLAVLTTGEPLAGCVPGLAPSDDVAVTAPVIITGVPVLDDLGHSYRYLDADGHWAGGTTRDDYVPLGRVSAIAVMRGMSGAPVLAVPPTPARQMVVGVVSARYNSADGWARDSVWVIRTENLTPLLSGLGDITLAQPGWAKAVELTLPLMDAVPPTNIGHVFISYVREDSQEVDRLQRVLEASGVRVWRDMADLWPGDNWRAKIRRAITDDALVFIACFSRQGLGRKKTYQNEELALAVDQIRLRPPDEPWLIPVRFDDCDIPEFEIGGGRTLTSIQRSDLFGNRFDNEAARLTAAVLRILGR